MLESHSSTLPLLLPSSSLQLPARAGQVQHIAMHERVAMDERIAMHERIAMDERIAMPVSICSLSPLLSPALGRSCCFSLFLHSLLKAEMSEGGFVLPLLDRALPAWVTALQLSQKLSPSGQETPEPHTNLGVNHSHWLRQN